MIKYYYPSPQDIFENEEIKAYIECGNSNLDAMGYIKDRLEEYYQMKVAGLTDTQEFYNIRAQITYIKEKNLKLYKKEIDAYFNEL